MPETRAAFRLPLQVRFRDCDSMGHVNHAVFFTFLEQCRLVFWHSLTGEASPLARVIVAHAECDYRAPAYFADHVEVRLNVGDIGRSSFVLTYEIENTTTSQILATLLERRFRTKGKRRHVPVLAMRLLPPLVRPFNEVAARLMTLGLFSATESAPFPDWKVNADRFGVSPRTVETYVEQMA